PPVLYTLQVPICDIHILFVTHHTHSAFFFCHLSCNRITLSSSLTPNVNTHAFNIPPISHFQFCSYRLTLQDLWPPFSFFFSYPNCNHFCSWDCYTSLALIS